MEKIFECDFFRHIALQNLQRKNLRFSETEMSLIQNFGRLNFVEFLNRKNQVAQKPGDFVTKVKQINSQSDIILMSSFAGPS